jgi:Cys-rich protein (TIGR01571 family)
MIHNPILGDPRDRVEVVTAQPLEGDTSQNTSISTSQPHSFHQVSLPAGSMRPWSTNTFDCMSDEESCWWGTWCCWLLHARTTASFDLGDSLKLSLRFWALIATGVVLLMLGLGPIAILYFIVLGVYLAFDRAKIRSSIRSKLAIYGDPSQDFMSHWCWPCCSVCQEAREANIANMKSLDFCSGEELSNIKHEHAAFNGEDLNGGDLVSHVNALSKTSKIILTICAVVAFMTILLQLIQGEFLNIAVLLITFFQPFLILYVVYWRAR